MTTITRLVMTCEACPSQWDGWTADGTYFYFRFRHGYLSVGTTPGGWEVVDDIDLSGAGLDGVLSEYELAQALSDLFTFDVEIRR